MIGKQLQRRGTHAISLSVGRIIPPEQCLAQPVAEGGRGDVYSLGCVLYEMLCGQPPFLSESDELLRRQIFESPVPPRQRVPALSERIDALTLRMLAKSAPERPAMVEVVQALDAELGVRVPESPRAQARRPPALLLRGAATVDDADAGARYLSEESRGETVLPEALLRGSTKPAPAERPPMAAQERARDGSQRRKNRVRLGVAAAAAAAGIAALFGVQRLLPRAAMHTVRLPGGTFTMGSSPEEIDAAFFFCQRLERDEICMRSVFEREQPLRTVKLTPFAMDATEVTNERFAAWLNDQRGLRTVYDEARHTRWVFDGDVPLVDLYPTFPTYGLRRAADGRFVPVTSYAARPVTQVTWLAASRYCAAHGQRLPTEAEWEYAARPRPGDRFPWGSDPPRCDGVVFGRLREQECAGREAEPAPVGSSWQDRTPQGIYDLAGNVAEWVQDSFAERYPDCGGSCTDPVVPPNKNASASKEPILRVFRGGDWAQVAVILRSAGRGRWRQSEALQNVGFRCVSPM